MLCALINEPKNFGQSDKYNRVNYWKSLWFACFKYTSSVPPEIILCMIWIHHRKMSSGSKWIKMKRAWNEWERGREGAKKWSMRGKAWALGLGRRGGAREVEMKDFCLQQYNLTRVTYTFETDATLWNDCFRFPLHMDEESDAHLRWVKCKWWW